MKIIVSGGGTGGHIYPALTVIEALRAECPAAEFLYVGTKEGLEADIVPKEGIPFRAVDAAGLKRSLSPANFLRIGRTMKGVLEARSIVREFAPDLVIGTGGYAAGPILLTAALSGVPTLIQEQNVYAGITNKLLARFVTKIAVGLEEARHFFPAEKTVVTGNPIRGAVLTAEPAYDAYGFTPEKPVVLISGGSRGARTINLAMVDVLRKASGDAGVQYFLVTGQGEYALVRKKLSEAGISLETAAHIKVEPYLYDMPSAMAMADLAVFRAGATGIAELTAKGIPSILVPYPYAAENHQEKNARALERVGAARVILNRELTGELLKTSIDALLGDRAALRAMGERSLALGKPNAARDIAKLGLSLIRH
ncbi:undecaprenyldiphospho-muramoylpentapeptide beta-N-acetylglucosaminyltransferase [Selenomonas sp. TAMA-11512]|uniref:undecaprenyldiphospho-muramoylpentapeptide beta-N-acetylglucosaminyltransferase n=1 Tax=Selenomonas sp. TAMA-11512 TaxID=3095337 RepID=UPI0030CF33F7